MQEGRSLVRTNNQLFSLTDQLNMGVRVLELDTHWVEVGGPAALHPSTSWGPQCPHILSVRNRKSCLLALPNKGGWAGSVVNTVGCQCTP